MLDMGLLLQNVHAAFVNQQYSHAQFLLEHVINLAEYHVCVPSLSPLDVSIGLHRGLIRDANEDCVLALQGVMPLSEEPFGLFIVCDGMGGHAHGQEASHLAIQTILEHVLPHLLADSNKAHWQHLLVESIHLANRAIYLRNQFIEQQLAERNMLANHPPRVSANTSPIHHMGTTITAVLLFGKTAYIANVGDSRTYLYSQGLHRITKDHSIVASLFERGIITEEDMYVHPQRNQITRALGSDASVEVDTFVLPLQSDAILLLCSDGLWEMMRDRKIEESLACPWASASFMTSQLVQFANDGGGADNIGCIVVQLQRRIDISATETTVLEPVSALTRLVTPSSL